MIQYHKEQTVGQIVTERPSLSVYFEKIGIDYCCGGNKTLEEACQEKKLHVDDVVNTLNQLVAQKTSETEKDWSKASISELVDHILEVHHSYVAESMPRLEWLVNKVANVHGDTHPELLRLRQVYAELKNELEPHMQKEEMILFPGSKQLDAASSAPMFPFGNIRNPINAMNFEHETAGRLLEEIRRLTNDYTVPPEACNSYRAMLDGLAEFEADLHLHIHKENNILFPKVIEKAESFMCTS